MRGLKVAYLAVALLSLGCSTAHLTGRRITEPPKEGREGAQEGTGITYYLTTPRFEIDVKGLHDKKKAEPAYDIRMTPTPDPDHRYEVRLESGTLTTDHFNLTLTGDGRLVTLGATSEDTTGAVVKGLGSFVGELLKLAPLVPLSAADDVGKVTNAVNREVTALSKRAAAIKAAEFVLGSPPGSPEPGKADLESASEALREALTDTLERVEKLAQDGLDTSERAKVETFNREALALVKVEIGVRARLPEYHDLKKLLDAVQKVRRGLDENLRMLYFADLELRESEESPALLLYETILELQQVETVLSKAIAAASPESKMRVRLEATKNEAEAAYAAYVAGEIDRAALQAKLTPYSEAVGRLLELDTRLQARHVAEGTPPEPLAQVQIRELMKYLQQAPSPGSTGNESKAYKDYNAALDQVVQQIHGRLGALLDETKKDKLPRGTQVTRTLERVRKWPIGSICELREPEQRLLKLADLWIRYGGMEAVVFTAQAQTGFCPDSSNGGAS